MAIHGSMCHRSIMPVSRVHVVLTSLTMLTVHLFVIRNCSILFLFLTASSLLSVTRFNSLLGTMLVLVFVLVLDVLVVMF